MKKITAFVLAASMTVAATGAFAGGMADPVVEPEPMVVAGGSSSNGGTVVLLLLGAVLVAAATSGSN